MIHITSPATERARSQPAAAAGQPMPNGPGWHKWREVLPALRQARETLDLNKGRLDLLEALLACLPSDRIALDRAGELIVFGSNARLAQMTNRSCDKTITRLITELAGRGLVRRKSSPNGKRYTRSGGPGARVAYGIDLAPLLHRLPEILEMAQADEHHALSCRLRKEDCSLTIAALGEIALDEAGQALVAEARRILRRKPDLAVLSALAKRLETLLTTQTTGTLRSNAPQTTCHTEPNPNPIYETRLTPQQIAAALPEVTALGQDRSEDMRDLIDHMRLALGISLTLWREVIQRLGFEEAGLVMMHVYERGRGLRNPGGYLRSLLQRRPEPDLGSRLITEAVAGLRRNPGLDPAIPGFAPPTQPHHHRN